MRILKTLLLLLTDGPGAETQRWAGEVPACVNLRRA